MRVVVSACIADGTCEYCQRHEYSACQTTNDSKLIEEMTGNRVCGIFGISHLMGAYPGGQAEFVRVPFADVNCLPLPEDVPDDKGLFLSDVIPTSYHGTELADVKAGDTVGIWGLGPIGLLAARWCQIRGAARVIGIDSVEERLACARDKLGIEVINFSKESTLDALHNLVPRGLDAAIECAGFRFGRSLMHRVERTLGLETDAGDILTECIMAVRPFGRIALIGEYMGTVNHFPIGPLMEKSINLRGGPCPMQKYWPLVLQTLQSGEFDPTFVITHRLRLRDAPEAFRQFYKREGGIIKVFIRP
jgi:threonine dehydrogenase-like Zn-dependent dehydrogenase